jgi:hypothetical protein
MPLAVKRIDAPPMAGCKELYSNGNERSGKEATPDLKIGIVAYGGRFSDAFIKRCEKE